MTDLRGKKIGSPGVGSASWIELGMILEKHGMGLNDVTLIKLRGPDRVNALKAGTIDAAIISEPMVAKAKAMGVAAELAGVGDELGDWLEGILITTEDVIKNRRPQLEKFLKTYVKGVNDFFSNPTKPEYLKAIGKYTKLDPQTITNSHLPYIPLDARMPRKNIKKQLDWLVKKGHVKKAFPLEDLLDESMLPR